MISSSEYAGLAALSICEALLLAIGEHHILPAREIAGLLEDAAVTHENATGTEAEIATHRAVADLINGIIDTCRTARPPQA